MKKHLLILAGAALAAGNASAQESIQPQAWENTIMTAISPNGLIVAGANPYLGSVDVLNVETGIGESYFDENGEDPYDLGTGANSVSDNGIILISTNYNGTPSYVENGVVKTLSVPAGITSALANAITPDGSRIAGTIGIDMSLDATEVMQRPVVWNRLPDGSYSEPVQLPYPNKDFTGRLPQYVLITGISADGKTIASQLHDYSGQFDQCMVYTENAEGEWQYKEYGRELICPADTEFPTYPGEAPVVRDFMSAETIAAFEAAQAAADEAVMPALADYMSAEQYAAYLEASETGWASYGDYMTEEELEAYNAAVNDYYAKAYPSPQDFATAEELAAYQAAYEAWEEAFFAFSDALDAATLDAVYFDMNVIRLSPNGLYYAVSGSKIDWDSWEVTAGIYVFNVADGSCKVYPSPVQDAVCPTVVTNEGNLLAVKPASRFDTSSTTYLVIDGEYVALNDYVQANFPNLYKWMEENMIHEYGVWDEETEEDVMFEGWFVGQGCATPDLSTIVTWTFNTWDYETAFNTYYIPMKEIVGVKAIEAAAAKKLSATLSANGILTINGHADSVKVYDLSGRLVFSADKPAQTVNTGLTDGMYVVKVANAADRVIIKAAL